MLVGAGGAGRALAFGARNRGARVVIFNRNFGKFYDFCLLRIDVELFFLAYLTVSILFEERAKALAQAVSGEAVPYECLDSFRVEKGMILANASAVGMQPNSHQSPVSKVLSLSLSLWEYGMSTK